MEPLRIPCPECGRQLKLKSEKLLGKKVKCPGCAHPFVLQRPADDGDEELVDFEMASAADEPATGTAARWVPDEPESLPAATAVQAPPAEQSGPGPIVTGDSPGPLYGDRDAGGVGRLKELRRKQQQRRNVAIIFGVVTALGVGGAWWGISSYKAAARAKEIAEEKAKKEAEAPKRDRAYQNDKEAQKRNLELVAQHDPTKGEPIDMRFLPQGAGIIFHFRPAELVGSARGANILKGLGPLWASDFDGDGEVDPGWALKHINTHVGPFPLDQIEELTMCLYLRRGREPEVASVVRFTAPLPKSELINTLFENKISDTPEIWVNDERAYMIQDENRTLAICMNTTENIQDLKNTSGTTHADAVTGVKEVVRRTDRARQFTIAFRPADLNIYRDELFDELAKPAAEIVARWFGEDVAGLAWSLHTTDRFHSEIVMEPRLATATDRLLTPNRLQEDFRERIDGLPQQVYAMVRYMDPATVGRQRLIGRFPAMTKAFSVGTLGGSDDEHVRLVSIIPHEKAAENLVIASLFTWHESTQTDFNRTLEPVDPTGGLPDLVVDRLKTIKVEGEFNGLAMDSIFEYVGDETKVEFYLYGDALKDAGFTKVMRQTMSIGMVPAIDLVGHIVKRYDEPNKKMALVIDEANKRAIITTAKFAEREGQTIYEFK